MRDFIDAILAFIGSESLSDDEFATIEIDDEEYSVEVYEAILGVLQSRENVSGQAERLQNYFLAAGASVEDSETKPPASEIFLGDEI